MLPARGDGYYIPRRWRERKRNYGTDELVRLMVRVARRVAQAHRGSLLGMADLSPRGGGPTLEHRSHRSGRDVDLVFYYTDDHGKPVKPEEMIPFDKDGISLPPNSQPTTQPQAGQPASIPAAAASATRPQVPLKLDLDRNWALVRALVLDPKVSVQWVFVDRTISRLLLHHARKKREPAYIVERAAAVLHHAGAHTDHMHVRVFCEPSDRSLGCVDRGPSRWLKKEIKYLDSPPPPAPATRDLLAHILVRRLRSLGL